MMQMGRDDSLFCIESLYSCLFVPSVVFRNLVKSIGFLVIFINFQPGVCVAIYAYFSKFILRKNLGGTFTLNINKL